MSLYFWRGELTEILVGTQFSMAYTHRRNQLDLIFESPDHTWDLLWRKAGQAARLELYRDPGIPRKKVSIFGERASIPEVASIQIHPNDRLLRLILGEEKSITLGFFPGALNVCLDHGDGSSEFFLKAPEFDIHPEDWSTRPPMDEHLGRAGMTRDHLAGVGWDPDKAKLIPVSPGQSMMDLTHLSRKQAPAPASSETIDWVRQGQTVYKRWSRKLENMRRELTENRDWERLELEAQALVIAQSAGINPVRGEVKLPDELSPTGSAMGVQVDDNGQDMSVLVENAFKKARKARNGQDALRERIPIVEVEISHLEDLIQKAEPDSLAAFLKQHGESTPGTRSEPAIRQPYTRYPSPGGYDILVGRTSRDNDTLTFKIASKDDWWFHARGVPGSHVILKTGKQQPEHPDLLRAAELAARNSDSKHAGIVVVQYCQRKHLTKPKGGSPGMVLVHREQTLTIDLDQITSDQ